MNRSALVALALAAATALSGAAQAGIDSPPGNGGGGGGGSPLTTTDGTNTVANTTTQTFGTGLTVGGGGGSASIKLTSVANDQSAADYTIVTGDAAKTVLVGAHTYTLPQAGTTGFGAGWSACLLNTGAGNATVNTATSIFQGATGTSTLTIRRGDWACPSSDGTNYQTVYGWNGIGIVAGLPLIAGGTGAPPGTGTRSGNTTTFVTTTGAQTSGKCVTIDANGNHVADANACGGGGGSGGAIIAFSSGTATVSPTNPYLGQGQVNANFGPIRPFVAPKAMTVKDLRCWINGGPGSGVTILMTAAVGIGGSSTGTDNTDQQVQLSGTTNGSTNVGANTGVALSVGDTLGLHMTVTGGTYAGAGTSCSFTWS